MRITLRTLAGPLALAAAALAAPASAQTFSNAYFFGDSLSDTGNIFTFTGGATPAAPYFAGRFSDGPVWVETLAAGIGHGAAATASLQGGNNYAFGGARTSGGTIPSLLTQVGSLTSAPGGLDPTALYVVVAGGNDMRDARSAFPTMDAAGATGRAAAAAAAANNIGTALQLLAADGARNVLIANLPDLGTSPEAVALGLTAPSTDATLRFNAAVSGLVGFGQGLGLNMSFFDLAGLAATVRADALGNGGAVYGITNVFTPCGSFTGSVGVPCAVSAFSDALHPSARAHQIFGQAAVSVVPEPGAVWMLAAGLAGLGALLRRRAT